MFTKHFSPKLFIIITIPLAVVIILLGGFWYLEGKDLEWGSLVLKGGQNEMASSSEEVKMGVSKNILKPEISTESWQTYSNKEYGFEVKYPKGWYWEDYSEDFKALELKLGFYPPDKSKGWEYVGDIELAVQENLGYKDIFEFYEKNWSNAYAEKKEKINTKNNYTAMIIYNTPGNIDTDFAMLECNKYFIFFDAPFSMARKELLAMVNEFLCLQGKN